MCVCVCVCVCVRARAHSHSSVSNSATPWIAAHQVPLSMKFSRQEYWSDCHFLLQEIFQIQGYWVWKLHLLCLLHWQADSLWLSYLKGPHSGMNWHNINVKISQKFTQWVLWDWGSYPSSEPVVKCLGEVRKMPAKRQGMDWVSKQRNRYTGNCMFKSRVLHICGI